MFCIASFLVLSILGIFSASNRALAKEALDCVFRRITFRPCTTGFDVKMKSRILGGVINRSEGAARFLNRYFEVLAWVFILLFLASGIFAVRGVYLFYTTGSCNGLNSSGFCVFDPAGANNAVSTGGGCNLKATTEDQVTLEGVHLENLPVMNATSVDEIVMIGCYHCDYTRETYPMIRELVDRYRPKFSFMNFPTKEEDDSFSRLAYCVNQVAPDRFWAFNDRMFAGTKAEIDDPETINGYLTSLDISPDQVNACRLSDETGDAVQTQLNEAVKTHFYGTPTIFIDGKAFVGPKPYRVYAIELKGLFFWLAK